MCDEIIDAEAKFYDKKTKTILRNFNEKKESSKTQNFYILFVFLLIAIVLLIAVIIYFCLIEHKVKQKHLLPFNVTNN